MKTRSVSLKIMVVDDDPRARALVGAVVEPLGYGVVPFGSGKEALRHIDKQKVDAVFVDVRMADLDGFELTRCVRNSRSNSGVPIVMITAADDVGTMREGFKAGVTFFLGKPLIPAKLRGLMKAIHSAALRERRRYVRLPLRTTVNCRAGNRQFLSDCANISETGMLLGQSGGLSVGQELQLEFTIPASRQLLRLRAKIVRKGTGDQIGLQFTEVPPQDLQVIQRYIVGRTELK